MFHKAQPIWIKGKECEMNTYAVFHARPIIQKGAKLHITGYTFYRVYVNDSFVCFGPARTASGYAREDIISLDNYIADEACEIVIESVGYYCRSLSTVLQPSFIMAEVECNGEVIAYTGRDFDGFLSPCKIREVERYSVQRHFCEVWDYREVSNVMAKKYRVQVEVLRDVPKILDRVVPYPAYEDIELSSVKYVGAFVFDEKLPYKEQYYSWKEVPKQWGRFESEQIKYHPYKWIQRQKQTIKNSDVQMPLTLKKGEYAILDFGQIEVGFLKASLNAIAESDVVIAFSEYYEGETFKFSRIKIHNALEYLFPEGDHREVMSFEPYTFRFVMIAVKEGQICLNSFGMKTYVFDTSKVQLPACKNKTLESICRAAVRTFSHNSVDLYMDCPSRERAGWLCDTYFTAKTEYALTGETKVEDAFLENYRLFKNEGEYPQGVLPMCYPSDANEWGTFIPQWTMWYILEVEEYIHKRGHEDMAEDFRRSIYDLLEFYKQYENEDGLLERLPSWNFVEWSDANSWTWDVNYPTNFLYAKALECIWQLYDDEECKRRSEEVRKVAVAQSFNGTYFVDHAVRDEAGILRLQKEASEAGQYYAMLFGGIDINSKEYRALKQLVLEVFTPSRTEDVMPEIMRVNAFIGAYLRLETLCKMGEYRLALENIEEFFGKMEERTGTLWEFRELIGSHDHGFASYVFVVIQEAMKRME